MGVVTTSRGGLSCGRTFSQRRWMCGVVPAAGWRAGRGRKGVDAAYPAAASRRWMGGVVPAAAASSQNVGGGERTLDKNEMVVNGSLFELDDPDAAPGMALWAQRQGRRIKDDKMLYELAFALESKLAEEPWEELLAPYTLTGREYVRLFKIMSRDSQKGLELTLDLFEYLKTTDEDVCNVYAYTTLINSCASFLLEEKVMALLEEMTELKIDATVPTYNAVLKCIRSRPGKIEKVLAMMKKGGYKPSTRTYTTVISAYARQGRWRKAVEHFEDMKRAGYTANQYTYGAVINAMSRSKDVDKCLSLFDEMIEKGIKPNGYVYSSLIKACGNSGEWEQAMDLFEEMQVDDCIKPDVVTYTCAMAACQTSGQWARAIDLYKEMKESGVAANRHTYRAVLEAAHSSGDKRVLEDIEKDVEKGGFRPWVLLKEEGNPYEEKSRRRVTRS